MIIHIAENNLALGKAAAAKAAAAIKQALAVKEEVNIILATGASQFATLEFLVGEKTIEWSRINMFHLDEYIGLSSDHKASFRKYLTERFIEKVANLKNAFLIDGEANPEEECKRLNELIKKHPIDIALVGIGENGHLAFNDPPADFDTCASYIIVNLDEPCRKQQLNEGWFNALDEVPLQAISMSIHQIMLSAEIICSVPDARKAQAVKNCVEHAVNNLFPASILQTHANCYLYLDNASAALLKK